MTGKEFLQDVDRRIMELAEENAALKAQLNKSDGWREDLRLRANRLEDENRELKAQLEQAQRDAFCNQLPQDYWQIKSERDQLKSKLEQAREQYALLKAEEFSARMQLRKLVAASQAGSGCSSP